MIVIVAFIIIAIIILNYDFQNFENRHLTLEIADTPEKREKGLMFRKHMPTSHGMLFIYPLGIHKMWMKNTYIPLDLLYLSDDFRIIGIEKNLKPHSLETRGLDIPVRYIIEVNAGSDFKVGQKINYRIM